MYVGFMGTCTLFRQFLTPGSIHDRRFIRSICTCRFKSAEQCMYMCMTVHSAIRCMYSNYTNMHREYALKGSPVRGIEVDESSYLD